MPSNTSVENYPYSNTQNHGLARNYSTNRSYASYTQPPVQTAVYYQYRNENGAVPTEKLRNQPKVYDMNRYQQRSDRVVVQLVDIDTVWDTRGERRKGRYQHRQQHNQQQQQQQLPQQKNENDVESSSTVDLDEDAGAEQSYKPAYCGEVVGITLRSPNMTFVGTIGSSRAPGQPDNGRFSRNNQASRIAWFKPVDQRVPLIILRDDDVPADLIKNADADA
ncbi:hypothetical protein HPULCUR_000600 [Helicostylum pulchrum]|uniref:Uncharacterized protein n=1 Tax=Helicostylum pulchrum TaxID=562976 RepID=A0ABP9XM22_9FUNG